MRRYELMWDFYRNERRVSRGLTCRGVRLSCDHHDARLSSSCHPPSFDALLVAVGSRFVTKRLMTDYAGAK